MQLLTAELSVALLVKVSYISILCLLFDKDLIYKYKRMFTATYMEIRYTILRFDGNFDIFSCYRVKLSFVIHDSEALAFCHSSIFFVKDCCKRLCVKA